MFAIMQGLFQMLSINFQNIIKTLCSSGLLNPPLIPAVRDEIIK